MSAQVRHRRRLLFLVSEDWYFVSHRLPLAIAARDAGYDVTVATQVRNAAQPIRDAGLALHPIRLDRSSLNPLAAVREYTALAAFYKRGRFDVVHHVALKPIVLGARAARAARVPAVVNAIAGLGVAFSGTGLKAQAVRLPIRAALRGALRAPNTRTIVQHGDDFNEVLRQGLAERSSLRVVAGSGVDVAQFSVAPPPGDGPPLVVLPARLLRHKGVLDFAQAARDLKARGISARFALVGTPDHTNPSAVTEDELAAIRQDGAVELWGWRSDMARVLAEASIVCLPSYYREGLPKSLLEAAVANRAIVTTDMPGCRDIVLGGEAGWCVPPRDPAALADALAEAIASPAERSRRTALASAHALAHYSLPAVTSATLAIYDELLAGPVADHN